MDEYWSLDSYDNIPNYVLSGRLERAGHLLKFEARKDVTVFMNRRLERQLLCYRNCDLEDLRKFAVDRKLLTKAKTNNTSRRKMTNLLEEADENPRFDRFTDLPAELRCTIYRASMEHLPDGLYSPCQPPVAQTCQLLRTEALPIFYQTQTFEIGLVPARVCKKKVCKFTNESQIFLWALEKKSLVQMRRIRFVSKGVGWNECSFKKAEICINNHGSLVSAVVKHAYGTFDGTGKQQAEALSKTLEQKLQTMFEGYGSEESGKRLRIEDIWAVRRAIEEVMF